MKMSQGYRNEMGCPNEDMPKLHMLEESRGINLDSTIKDYSYHVIIILCEYDLKMDNFYISSLKV